MKLLHRRNHYGINFSPLCNYSCSYCSVELRRGEMPGLLRQADVDKVERLLDRLPPAVIVVSGGEPALWKGLKQLVENNARKQPTWRQRLRGMVPEDVRHNFVFFSNVSLLPDWYFDDSVKLIMASFHREQVTERKFSESVRVLHDAGKRVKVKLMTAPGEEYENVKFFRELWDYGVPASFAPIEEFFEQDPSKKKVFDHRFISDLIEKYRTSALYTSRFFLATDRTITKLCPAGTKESFFIEMDGTFRRCVFQGPIVVRRGFRRVSGSLDRPVFHRRPQLCDRAQDGKHHLPGRRRSIHLFGEGNEFNPQGLEGFQGTE